MAVFNFMFAKLLAFFSKLPEDLCNISENDSIILIVGASGSWKSTFINSVVGARVAPVGEPGSIKPVTRGVYSYRCRNPSTGQKNIILVDTPPYDEMCPDGMKEALTKWVQGPGINIKLKVIYFHDISRNRLTEFPLDHLVPLRGLTGEPDKLVVVTTGWSQRRTEEYETLERKLRVNLGRLQDVKSLTMERFSCDHAGGAYAAENIVKKALIT